MPPCTASIGARRACAPLKCSRASALPTAPTVRCATSQAARCDGWKSRARCCIALACCYLTRRRSASTLMHALISSAMSGGWSPSKASACCGLPTCSTRSFPAMTSWCYIRGEFSHTAKSRASLPTLEHKTSTPHSCASPKLQQSWEAFRDDLRQYQGSTGRVFVRAVCHLPERHRVARGLALPTPARTLRFGAGSAAGVAVHFRGRLPPGAGHLHHPAIRNLHPLRGLHRARIDGDDPAVQRHAILALDGLRPRDGQYAHPAGESAAALVSAVLQASGGNRGLAAPGLCLPADCVALGYRAAADRLSHGPAGADPVRPDARGTRHADFFRHQTTREFRRRDELRYFPDVFRFVRALSAMAGAGGEPDALLRLPVQSIHPCGRVDPLRALRTNQLDLAGGGWRLHGGLHDRGGVRV